MPARTTARRHQSGQAMVVMILAMTVVLGGVAIVVDGGNGMTQQRATQNAADSAAMAGALTILEKLGGQSRTDADVVDAMSNAFDDNATQMEPSSYVDFNKAVVGSVGRGGSIPSEAWGVKASGKRSFNTLLAGVAGFGAWTARADATVLAGALRGACSALDGCAVMPVTFSIPITTCDGSSKPLRIGVDWPLVNLDTALADTAGQYESIVPLCKNGPGGVGWLDMGCGGTLKDQIQNPCNVAFDIPTWIHTSTGNPNSVESYVNAYAGTMLLIPMFDSTCRDIPSSGLPADCTDPGNGNNLYYHIPRFAEFLLDHAYIQGNNNGACNSAPGKPFIGGNGGTSCFKGWFVRYVMQGPVGMFEPCDGSTPLCSQESILSLQLVR